MRGYAGNLAENRADAGGNARHNGTGGYCHETGHQRVFNQVLTLGVLDDAEVPHQILELVYCFSLLFNLQCLGSTLISVTVLEFVSNPLNTLDDA